jgi:hypothetical protein
MPERRKAELDSERRGIVLGSDKALKRISHFFGDHMDCEDFL